MLRFQYPLTPVARELVVYTLEVNADELADPSVESEDWAANHPESAQCFTREQARATLLDLREKLDLPEEYIPTDYHWLFLYECLETEIAILNDSRPLDMIRRLRGLADPRDRSYLRLPAHPKGRVGFHIDFGAFADMYFWDTDFFLDPELFSQLDAHEKQSLGANPEIFGVINRLVPHPEELVLRRSDAHESTEPSQGSDEA